MLYKDHLSAIIVDDEINAISNFTKLIERYCPSLKLIDTATSADAAGVLINELKPDVVFLDISMPKKNGFELLNMLNYLPLIVFVTAHEQYALKAIKACAVDFLLKPVDVNELKKVEEKLQQVNEVRKINNDANYSSVVGNLVYMLRNPGIIKKITLPAINGYNIVDLDDILYLIGENNYTEFYTRDQQKTVVSKTLKDYEEMLTDSSFMRIHKSSIINLHYLKKLTKDNGMEAIMSDDRALSVSRRRTQELMDKAKQFIH